MDQLWDWFPGYYTMLKVYKPNWTVLLASCWVDRLSRWWKLRWLNSEGPASHAESTWAPAQVCSKFIWWAKVKWNLSLAQCAQDGWSSFVSRVVPVSLMVWFWSSNPTLHFVSSMLCPMIRISVINPEKVGPKLLLHSKTSFILPWPTEFTSCVWLAGPHDEPCRKCHFYQCIATIDPSRISYSSRRLRFWLHPIHISLMKLVTLLQLSSKQSTTHRHQAVPGLFGIYLENVYMYMIHKITIAIESVTTKKFKS